MWAKGLPVTGRHAIVEPELPLPSESAQAAAQHRGGYSERDSGAPSSVDVSVFDLCFHSQWNTLRCRMLLRFCHAFRQQQK